MECNQRFDHCSHGQFHSFVFARRARAKMPSLHLSSNWRCSTGFTCGHPFTGVSSNNKNLWLLCGFGNTDIYIYILFRYKYYLHLCLFAFVLKSFPFRFQIYHHSFAFLCRSDRLPCPSQLSVWQMAWGAGQIAFGLPNMVEMPPLGFPSKIGFTGP